MNAVVGSTVWVFCRLKKPRSREMSTRGYALHSVCLPLFPCCRIRYGCRGYVAVTGDAMIAFVGQSRHAPPGRIVLLSVLARSLTRLPQQSATSPHRVATRTGWAASRRCHIKTISLSVTTVSETAKILQCLSEMSKIVTIKPAMVVVK